METNTIMVCERLDNMVRQQRKIIELLQSINQILDVLGTQKIKQEHGG